MELFKNHPVFAGRPYSQWSKKLMNRDALAHSKGKTHVFHFSLERSNHTDHLHLRQALRLRQLSGLGLSQQGS